MPVILLADNGSTRADATLKLRHLAKNLSNQVKQKIHPVSLQHADKIAAHLLDDIPAQIFHEFMTQQLSQGERDFILLPLFFGKSKALTSYVPDKIELLKQQFGDFTFQIADVIYPLPDGEILLSEIIHEHIDSTAKQYDLPVQNIVVVDHGSPIPKVTEVRKHLVQSIQDTLPDNIQLEQAVMERREGQQYDFNGDLLEHWLTQKAQSGEKSAMVILLFFLAGRHAGKGGDIEEICQAVMHNYPDFQIAISPLISEHSKLLSILQSRLQDKI